jgi:hypothetical protein
MTTYQLQYRTLSPGWLVYKDSLGFSVEFVALRAARKVATDLSLSGGGTTNLPIYPILPENWRVVDSHGNYYPLATPSEPTAAPEDADLTRRLIAPIRRAILALLNASIRWYLSTTKRP